MGGLVATHGGHLFQGRYRTELVEDETYLWVLTRYVHLNPVRAGLSATPEAWIVEPRLFPPPRSPGLGGLRRVACGLGRRVRTDQSGGILPSLRGGRSDYPACPPVGPRHGMDGSSAVSHSWIVFATASAIRPTATCAGSDACFEDGSRPGDRGGVQLVRGQPGPTRRAWLPLVGPRCPRLPGEAPYRGHPRQAVPILGLSRPESVPNLSARFAALLQSESNTRRDLLALEHALGLSGENSKSV